MVRFGGQMRVIVAVIFGVWLVVTPRMSAACPDVVDLGTLIDDAPLNGDASTLTATVGPSVLLRSQPTVQYCPVATYRAIVYDVAFDYGATDGTIAATVTGGGTVATATRALTTCEESSGNCTLHLGGVATTASLSADTAWLLPVRTSYARVIKAVFAHGGAPGATDKITVSAWLVR